MIEKSIKQHYEEGEEVNPYRKGLEIIAGKGKGTFQTTAPTKITAKSLIQPTGKMTLPSVKASGTAPFIRTLPTIAQPSFDPNKYSGLASIIPKTEEGSYLDKYINRDPVRIARGVAEEEKPTVVNTAANEDINIASLVGTDKATTSSDIDNILAQLTTSPKTDTAITSTGERETATSYTDTQIQDIYKSSDQETKNLITNAVDKTNEILSTLNIDKGKVLTFAGKKVVTNLVSKELGIGSAGGIYGIILANTVGWLFNKFKGGKEKEEIEGIFSFDDEGSTDKEFKVSGTYGGNEVYSSDGSSVDSKTGDITNADGSHGGNIVDEFPSGPSKSAPKPTVTYTPPARPHGGGGGGGNGGGGGFGKGNDPGGGAAGSPFFKGGRVDKPFSGRSRDI